MKIIKRLFPHKNFEFSAAALPRPLTLLDVGARGGLQWPWDRLNNDLLSSVLVEPDLIEANRLQQTLHATNNVVLPYALGREGETLFLNLSRSPGASSIYLPNRPFLDQFPEADRFDVLEKIEMNTKSIDSLTSSGRIPQIDFAKLDTQGSELAILEGGRSHFAAHLVGLEVEVEFAELYIGQPLFGDVETFVRKHLGLELWDLRKTYWKYDRGKHVSGPVKGRLIFGDALFLRPLSGLEGWIESMSPDAAKEKISKLVVTAMIYGYVDYAASILSAPFIDRVIDVPLRQELQRAVNSHGNGFRPFRHGSVRLFMLLDALAMALKPTHAGWACIGQSLGSRRRGPFWF